MNKDEIDIVITWVNGNDFKWIKEYKKYTPDFISESNHAARFRDWDTLRYVLRGIEVFMPWVRKVHLVTMNQKPEWLNIENERLNLVSHKDIFKDKVNLPSFNSNAIELNFLGIENLAEQFILFNDDMLIVKPVKEEDFFLRGLPRDFYIENPLKDILTKYLYPNSSFVVMLENTIKIINKNFVKKNTRKENSSYNYGLLNNFYNFVASFSNKFYRFEYYHHPQPYLKKTWKVVTKLYSKEINETSSHKFRTKSDLSHYLFRAWHLANGQFIPRYKEDFITMSIKNANDAEEASKMLLKKRFVCLNDDPALSVHEYNNAHDTISSTLNDIFPEKSSFEI